MTSSAVIDPTGRYRYSLTRHWGPGPGPLVCWVMLNPSTADADRNDPTITRCIALSTAWGFRGLVVVNLFGWRATKPADLMNAPNPVGPENDQAIRRALRDGNVLQVIAAWGAHADRDWIAHRVTVVTHLLRHEADLRFRCELSHIGLTKGGHPRHPLYVRGDVLPQPWRPRG